MHAACRYLHTKGTDMAMTEYKVSGETCQTSELASAREMCVAEDFMGYLRRYAREKPQSAALICLGIGFVLGWKLKPW
jgi:hypothetical protein